MQEQNVQSLWQNVCQNYLEKEVPTLTYTTWLKPIEPILYDDETFILSVPNQDRKSVV